jgi:chromosome partitioning protein
MEESTLLPDLLAMARQRTDVVVVDTPPGLGPTVERVLSAAQHVIVPLQAEPLALQTTPQILRGIQDVVATNEELTLDGLVLTMYDETSETSVRVSEYVRKHLPRNMVFDLVIPRSTAAADAFAAGQPVVLRSPADAAAQAYVNLATELASRFE